MLINRIINGIVQGDNIDGVPLVVKILPKTTEETKNARPMEPMYTVIHNAGSPKADDTQLNTYMAQDDYKLWHFTVDHDSITQGWPVNMSCWAAGDDHGPGNMKGINIEIADKGTNEEIIQSIYNAFKLIYVLEQWKPSLIQKPHQFFSPNKKHCPDWILTNWSWDGYMAKYKEFVVEVNKPNMHPGEVILRAVSKNPNDWLKIQKQGGTGQYLFDLIVNVYDYAIKVVQMK